MSPRWAKRDNDRREKHERQLKKPGDRDAGDEMTPGAELRKRRIKDGLTQTQLGQFTGYTQASISQMERGQIGVQPRVAEEVGMVVTPRKDPPTTHRASGARKVQVVMSPEAAEIWDAWVVEARTGLLSASARVSGLIEAAGGEVEG